VCCPVRCVGTTAYCLCSCPGALSAFTGHVDLKTMKHKGTPDQRPARLQHHRHAAVQVAVAIYWSRPAHHLHQAWHAASRRATAPAVSSGAEVPRAVPACIALLPAAAWDLRACTVCCASRPSAQQAILHMQLQYASFNRNPQTWPLLQHTSACCTCARDTKHGSLLCCPLQTWTSPQSSCCSRVAAAHSSLPRSWAVASFLRRTTSGD
jgi:hypothetical protein